MALPSKEEMAVLETFRGKVADTLSEEEVSDDMFLLRWLRGNQDVYAQIDFNRKIKQTTIIFRLCELIQHILMYYFGTARDLDIKKAEEMLRNAIKWRKENHLDDMIIGKSVPPFYQENFPKWVDGMDREGRPVYTAEFGKWNVTKVVHSGKSHEFISYLTECFEEVAHAIKRSSELHPPKPGQPPITQVIAIYDWNGFAWSQLFNYQAVQNFLQIGSIFESYFPEILHTCYFINCPSLISSVLMLLKPILAAKTMAKVKCFGTDKAVWQEELLKHIDADQLRPQFGGTKDNDESPFS